MSGKNQSKDPLNTELPLHRFGGRATNILRRLNVRTVGDFLDTDWDIARCPQLGAGTRAELRAQQASIGHTSETVRAWLESVPTQVLIDSDDEATSSVFVVPEEWRDLPLSVSAFGTRARSVLERCELMTWGDFLRTDFATLKCAQMGVATRKELESAQTKQCDWLRKLLSEPHTPTELEALRNRLRNEREEKTPTLPAPADVRWGQGNILDLPNVWPDVVRTIIGRDERAYDILARRYNLEGRGQYKLEELGLALGVSRERVRQIEAGAIKKLRQFLNEGQLHRRRLQIYLHPALQFEIEELKTLLQNVGFPLPDTTLWKFVTQRYEREISAQQRPFFVLLLEVLDFTPFHALPPCVPRPLAVAWLDKAQDQRVVIAAANALLRVLLNSSAPLPLFDLLIEANRALKPAKRKTDATTLRGILALLPGIEIVAEDKYQAHFAELPSHVMRIERIMSEWAVEGKMIASVQELQQEINHRHALAGFDADASDKVIRSACVASREMIGIGKSGAWTLRENADETRHIHEIIEEALLVLNRPASVDEIAAYVEPLREVAFNSIPGTLAQHHKFQRVGRGSYALRSWGLSEASVVKRKCGKEYQEQFDDALLKIFLENDVQPVPLAELVRCLSQTLHWKDVTLRARVTHSPYLKFTPLPGKRLMAHWCDETQNESAPAVRQTKRGRIQNSARHLLAAAPEKRMASTTLTALIESETGYKGPVIYNSLACMPDVKREGEPRDMSYQLLDDV